MRMKSRLFVPGAVLVAALVMPLSARAHCDTTDGPVVRDATAALEQKDITPVLKWIKNQDEREVKSAFAKALAVRGTSAQARDLADQYFFETLVRIHRSGEGAPYTGLKPAGTQVDTGIREADEALTSNNIERLVHAMQNNLASGIRKRFAAVQEKKKHADKSVEAGREYVAAYVDYIHYVEGLEQQLAGAAHRHGAEGAAEGIHSEPASASH